MANIMNQVDVKNKTKRNGFDLSHKLCFTSQAGMLLPVLSHTLIPGDTVKLSVSSFTRTQPINTAAYTRIKEYYDFYFVPLHLLWSRAPQCIAQTNDLQQWTKPISPSSSANIVKANFPYINTGGFSQILSYCSGDANKGKIEPYFGFRSYYGAVRLLEHLGYGFRLGDNAGVDNYIKPIETNLNLFRLCAYQKIYNDWFRVSQWEPSEPWTFNLDYYDDSAASNTFYSDWQKTMISISQTSGDNLGANMLTMRFAPWPKDMFTGILPAPQFGNSAAVSSSVLDGSFHLNALNKPSGSHALGFNNNSPLVRFAHVKQVNGVTFSGSPIDSFDDLKTTDAPFNVLSSAQPLARFSSSDVQQSATFTILQLRLAEAQQKWAEITQSGRLDYKSQMQKHFGITPDNALAHRSEYLGGVSGVLDINEVVNTNLTGDSDANLAGKGIGVTQGHINYTAKEHGILMCIYHNEPLLDYGSNILDKQVQATSPNDLPIPEFDSIGMDALYRHNLLSSEDFGASDDPILGYVPRYIDYKTAVDKIYGAFNTTLSSWVSPISQPYLSKMLHINPAVTGKFVLKVGFLHVNPAILNPIFGVNADLSPATDQFLHNVFFDFKAVRNLDRNGLPY